MFFLMQVFDFLVKICMLLTCFLIIVYQIDFFKIIIVFFEYNAVDFNG
jgi:hypothetical protein